MKYPKLFKSLLSISFLLLFFALGFFLLPQNEEFNSESFEIPFSLSKENIFQTSFQDSINSFALKIKNATDLEKSSTYHYRTYDKTWSNWEKVSEFEPTGKNELFSELHFVGKTNKLEIKSDNKSNNELTLLVFKPDNKKSFSLKKIFDTAIAENSINIVSRASWGANENLRFYDENNPPISSSEGSEVDTEWLAEYAEELKIVKLIDTDEKTKKQLIWPLEYNEKIEKIIIHHSAGRIPACEDEEDFLRSIYKFHTVSKGWGDIGYNFVVGPCSGKIYEGRAGGFGVKGAHAAKFNSRTSGIMIMGNYQEVEPSNISIQSVTELVKFLTEKYGIWPEDSSEMRGIDLPNIIGHRDVGRTSCPGNVLYSKLPLIRANVAKGYRYPDQPYSINESAEAKRQSSFSAQSIFTNPTQVFIKPGEKEKLTFLFRNSGHRIWNNKTTLKLNESIPGITLNGKSEGEFATLKERTVAPGMTGSFQVELNVKATVEPKNYTLRFNPFINGVFDATESSQRFIVIVTKDKESQKLSQEELKKIDEIFKDYEKNGNKTVDPEIETPKLEEKNPPKQSLRVFNDVDETNVFFSFIKDLKENEIIHGNNGFYHPNNLITRGEFAKVVANAAKLDLAVQNKSFFDIAKSPFENSIRILQSHNIVRGEAGMYYPNRPISRGEAITIVVRAFNIEATTDHYFRDIKGTAFEKDILKAAGAGIIGKGRIFDPFSPITRDQVAKIVSLARKVNKNLLALKNGNEDSKIQSLNEDTKQVDYGPTVRIDLGFSKENFTLISNSTFDLYAGNAEIIKNVPKEETVRVYSTDNEIKIEVKGNTYSESSPIRLIPRSEDGVIEIVGERRTEYNSRDPFNRYREEIEIRKDPENSNNLYLINVLPIEKYLWGLGEEPDGQPIEKVKTIVVMARSYIENYRRAGGKFKERFADLKADGRTSQVYLGYNFEINNKITPKIARETWGEVLTYNGQVIRAPYFSKSGGHTFTPGTEGNTWNPEPFPFAKRVEDPWSCGKDLEYIKLNGPVSCPEEQRGHGVGVSAWGAGKMAEAGIGYKQILKYYLTGIEFEKIY